MSLRPPRGYDDWLTFASRPTETLLASYLQVVKKKASGHDEPTRPTTISQDSRLFLFHFICSNLAPFNDHLRLTSVLSVKHRGAE